MGSIFISGCGTEDTKTEEPTLSAEDLQYENYSDYAAISTINIASAKINSGKIEFNIENFRILKKGAKYTFMVEPYIDLTNKNTSADNFVGSAKFECNGDANIKCIDVKKITCERTGYEDGNRVEYRCYLNDNKTLSTVQSKKTISFEKYADNGDNNNIIVSLLNPKTGLASDGAVEHPTKRFISQGNYFVDIKDMKVIPITKDLSARQHASGTYAQNGDPLRIQEVIFID